jgi:hypothetical protein
MTGKLPHEGADPPSWSRARHREAALRPLADQSPLSETIVQDAVKQIGVSRSHFYRLLAARRRTRKADETHKAVVSLERVGSHFS